MLDELSLVAMMFCRLTINIPDDRVQAPKRGDFDPPNALTVRLVESGVEEPQRPETVMRLLQKPRIGTLDNRFTVITLVLQGNGERCSIEAVNVILTTESVQPFGCAHPAAGETPVRGVGRKTSDTNEIFGAACPLAGFLTVK